jgi:hypothetical protein
MFKSANLFMAAVAVLIYATAARAADDPKWLKDARARESKPIPATPLASKDGWMGAVVPAKVVGAIEKDGISYGLELDIGGEQHVYCEIFPDGFDAADRMRRMLATTMQQISQSNGKIEMRAVDSTDAGVFGGVPYLRADWLYRVNDGKESKLGGLKQIAFEKDGHGIYCAHADIGYSKTFGNVANALAMTLQAAAAAAAPYYTEISTATILGHKVGYTVTSLTRDGEGDTEMRRKSALLLATPTGAAASQDAMYKEWVHPDASLINALHLVSDNGEISTNVTLSRRDDRWIIVGDHRHAAVTQTLAPDATPGTWVGQSLALRKLLAGANPVGSEVAFPLWMIVDPTKLTDVRTKVVSKAGAKQYAATMTAGGVVMNATLDALGTMPSSELRIGQQTVKMERVYVNGKF